MAKTLKTFDLGGVSPVMPNFSDVTPKLTPPPNINPGTYGSGSSGSSSALSGLSKLFGFANVSNPLGWASLGANVLGNILNHSSAKDAQKLQYQMFKEQLKFNHDEAQLAFDREARYNSEVSQVGRMRAAGLNPALMFKGADSVNSSAASAPSAPDLKYPLIDSQLGSHGLESLLQGTDLLSRNESNLAMINQLKQLTDKYGKDSEYGRLMNELFKMTFDNQVQDKALHNKIIKVQIDNYVEDTALKASERVLNNTKIDNYAAELGIRREQIQAALKSAIISAGATKYAAKTAAEASKYSTDKNFEVNKSVDSHNWIIQKNKLSRDFEIALRRNNIEDKKVNAMVRYFESQADLNELQYDLNMINTVLNVAGGIGGKAGLFTPSPVVVSGFSMSH